MCLPFLTILLHQEEMLTKSQVVSWQQLLGMLPALWRELAPAIHTMNEAFSAMQVDDRRSHVLLLLVDDGELLDLEDWWKLTNGLVCWEGCPMQNFCQVVCMVQTSTEQIWQVLVNILLHESAMQAHQCRWFGRRCYDPIHVTTAAVRHSVLSLNPGHMNKCVRHEDTCFCFGIIHDQNISAQLVQSPLDGAISDEFGDELSKGRGSTVHVGMAIISWHGWLHGKGARLFKRCWSRASSLRIWQMISMVMTNR